MALVFDAVYNSEGVMRGVRESQRAFAELRSSAENEGRKIDAAFNKQIYEGSQSVNALTGKIIDQKKTVRSLTKDIDTLTESYKKVSSDSVKGKDLFASLTNAKSMLKNKKEELLELQTQQAQVRLSVRMLKEEYSLYQKEGRNVVESNNNMSLSFKKTIAAIGGVAALKQLGSEIIKVRGEFQSMQTAIETLVGKDMAANLIPQIKELAKVSPLTLSDMVGAEKMMLGFNIRAEDTIKYLQALGDISMGDSQKFNSLTLAFSQMSAAGKLMGQDLNQMINAGFNPLQTISEKTGKSIATLKDEMSQGALSAELVQQAFIDATSAGGRFYQMSENASKTINGQLSMLQDALDEVFNEIGTKGEGAIMSGIQATTSLIQNYETVGKILTGLIGVYGTYRTAAMLVTAVHSLQAAGISALTTKEAIHYAWLVATKKAQLALNATMLTNPYVLLAAAVAGTVAVIWALHDGTTAAEKAQESYNKKVEDAAQKAQDHKQKLEGLISELQNEVTAETRKMEILDEIKKGYPSLFQKFIDEKGHIKDLTEGWKAYNEEASKNKAIQNKNNVSGTKKNLQEYRKMVSLWDKYGEDPNFHKNELSVEEATLASKYSNETLGRLKNKIEAGERELSLYEKDVREDNFNQWKVDLTKQTDKQIEVTRDALVKRAQAANGDKTRLATIGKYIIALETEQKSRSGEKKAGAEWLSSYKKAYEDADKAYNDFLKSKQVMFEADRDKELEKLKGLRDAAKATYEKKGGSASSDTKQENLSKKKLEAANELKVEQAEHQRKLEEYKNARINQEIQTEFDIRQAGINAKEEGFDKEKAQIDLNYDKLIEENRLRQEQWVKELQGNEKEQWLKDNPNYKKEGKVFTPTSTVADLSVTQQKQLKDYTNVANEYQKTSNDKLLKDLFDEYQNYEQRRTAINKKYDAERKTIETGKTADGKDVSQELKDAAIVELEKKRKDAIKGVNNEEMTSMQKTSDLLVRLFGDASNKSVAEINKIISETEQLMSYLSKTKTEDITPQFGFDAEQLKTMKATPEQIKAMQKALEGFYDVKVEKDPFSALVKDIKNLFKTGEEEGEDKKSLEAKLAKIGESASAAADMVGSTAGSLSDMFAAMGNDSAAEAMDTVQNVMSAVSNIGEGFAKGGIVGGIAAAVGEAANFIGQAFAATARHKAALQEIMNETIAQQREYNLLLMQQNLEYEKATTIFGTDVYGKAANAVRVMKDAVADLKEELKGSGAYSKGYSFSIKNGIVDDLTKAQRDLYNAYEGLANIEIKTGHKKTGLFGWGKGKDIYSSILSVYPELIKANGEFDASLAETILNTREMSDESKKSLQNMIDLANQAKEAYEAINDYFTDIFGELGNTMSDALVDAFRNGTDAAQAFTDSVSGMLETLAKQMVYSVTLGPLLEKTQTRMMDVMKNDKLSNEEKFKQWAGILDGMTDEAIGAQDMANRLLDSLKQSAADNGFDIFSKSKETLDTFVSQMQSAFTSLDVTAKDVSDNIYDYFRQAMINALYEKEYKSKIEELYKSFEDKSADGLSDSDMAQLNAQVDQYINEMLKGVEGVNSLFADKLNNAENIQSFVDNVKSAMSGIEATAEDVTDNIFEYIRQQMVDKMFADTFQPQIEEFYKKVQAAMSDGSVTDEEKDALRKEAEKLANDITAAKDILSDTLGVTADNLKKEAEAEFKSFSDGILSSLYNAEVTAEAISKNIADSMRQELIKAMYMEEYEPRIKAIWDKWKEYSSDGLVTDEERASIKDDINDLSKEVADAAKDISDAWTEAGEAVYDTFESFSNSIKSVLQNAETTAEDVAKNIYQFMRNALVNSMFAEQVQPQIKAWYDKYAEYMKDGAIDTTERKTLDEMIAEIQKAGMEIVDAANGLFPSLDTGAIQEVENAKQEWESFSDSMLNSLYDIEASASDISDDMSEYMRKALIKAMYVNNYKPQMQKWYNEWQRAMGDDIITSEEKQTLDSMKQEMLDGMKKEADAINQMFDSMYSQEASSKGFEGMSQDEGEELNGRFTALQIAGEEIKNQTIKQTDILSRIYEKMGSPVDGIDVEQFRLANVTSPSDNIKNSMLSMLSSMNLLSVSTNSNGIILTEIRNIMISSNGHLEDISKYTKTLLDVGSKLDSINKSIQKAL